MSDKLTLELARFFIDCWGSYTEDASEEMHHLIVDTPFIREHTITAQEAKDETHGEWDEDDIVYVLSELGEEARKLVEDNAPESA